MSSQNASASPAFTTTLLVVAGALVSFSALTLRMRWRLQNVKPSRKKGLSRMIFLGSGCSGGTPIALCLLGLIPGRPEHGCEVCRSAQENPNHPNHRGNPSVLLQNPTRTYNALIDCGKTFREAALTWFPKYDVRGIQSVLLTHEHADATFGLDEIRMVQNVGRSSALKQSPVEKLTAAQLAETRKKEITDVVDRVKENISIETVPGMPEAEKLAASKAAVTKSHPLASMYDDVTVHCMKRTRDHVASAFPYLVSKGKGDVPRFVSQLAFETFPLQLDSRFNVKHFFAENHHLEVIPLPVEHGADFMCAGFQFGRKDVVVYISDVSKIPDETLRHLRDIPRIRMFVVDSLRPVNFEKHTRPMVHFDLEDALNTVRSLGKPPVQTFLIGLGHEFDYESTNKMLSTLPKDVFGDIQCSVDGMCIDLDL